MSSSRTSVSTAAAAAAATTPAVMMMTPMRAASPSRGADLITAAGAVTHDGPSVRQSPPRAKPEPEEHDRPAGPAMLLAALALMSGIALRRFGARKQ
jgi:hypothetical protein